MSYKVSVITPFHNVDLDVFANGVDSVLKQTIGFENIEWIIVVHNSGQEYLEGVRRMVGQYENVKIEVLNNEIRTPSSPRNHGLAKATAPVVSFLDGDDSFTPECLGTALSHMKKTNAQITWFRREFELETDSTIPITEIVLWDQTREEIIVDRDHWDDEKMFSGICGMVTSRIYDRRFLEENGIRFDESVPFGEDYLFNLEAYGHAEKICYLPQLIGYHYFINSGSLVQSQSKTGEVLLSYARGYKKVFDTGLKYGFYMNAIILGLCCVIARFMISSDKLTFEDRVEIKKILEPYLEMMSPIKVSKIYSEKAVKERYDFPREVILHPEKFAGKDMSWDSIVSSYAGSVQPLSPYQNLLRSILELNQSSDMGRRYDFADILTMTGYQSKLPVMDYDVYYPLVRLQTNIGESGIFTSDKIDGYLFTSGTIGVPKLIPYTKRQFDYCIREFTDMVKDKVSFLMFESLPKLNRYNDNTYLNTVSGMILDSFFDNQRSLLKGGSARFTAPDELLFPEKAADMSYARMLFAIKERNVEQMIAPFTWGITEAFDFIRNNWNQLCDDIESGTLRGASDISDDMREKLEIYLKPDPDRANELRAIFIEGFDMPVARKIWKKLDRIIAAGTGAFKVYTDRMREYTGDVPHSNGYYLCSESLIGTETKQGLYKLDLKSCFVEFVPIDDPNAAPVLAGNVEIGKEYTLLLTTFSGLYRYKMDDVVKIHDVVDFVPIFSVEYRLSETIRDGEVLLNDSQIYGALREACTSCGVRLYDYAYMFSDNHSVTVFAEFDDDVMPGSEIVEKLSEVFDNALCSASADYHAARNYGRLNKAKMNVSEPESHLLYRDIERYRRQTAPDQIKPVRCIDNPKKEQFFTKLQSKD